ncbi:MAG TPA: tetratricopeptide repeat protein [Bacteroidales bacterium]|nr:tetratricopeptide repeat protein [Bacteroidales bacterium]
MKRLLLSPALLLVVLFALSSISNAQDLNSAIQLTKSEQYDKAGAIFEQLTKSEPANGKVYFYLGENILADYYSDTISNSLTVVVQQAKGAFQKGAEVAPNDPLNYIGLAKIALLQDDEKTAEEMRTKAKSFLLPYKKVGKKMTPPAPEYAFTLAKIAESYIYDGQIDTAKALPLLREALKIDNKNSEIYLIAGDIYNVMKDLSKAVAYYGEAEYYDPQSPTAAMKRGNIYVKARAFTAAAPYFETAIELNPNFAPAYRELGQLYMTSGAYEKAKTYFEKYLELTAGNIPAKSRYVNALFGAKDYEGVIKNVEEIFKVDQSKTYMNRIAGYSSFEKEPPDYNQALAYMDKLFANLDPKSIIWKDYLYLARILIKKNADYTKRIDELNSLKQQLEKERGKSSTANAAERAKSKTVQDNLAKQISDLESKIASADTELDRAFEAYGKLIEMKPDKIYMTEVGNQYYAFRRYNDAAKFFTKILDPSKDNTDDLMKIGRAYYTGENLKAADSVFSAIIKTKPDYIPAYSMLASTYAKMDPDIKRGAAKPKFQKVLEAAQKDSIANAGAMMDALIYLSANSVANENYSNAREYYNRMVNLSDNKDYKTRGLNGLANIEIESARKEKTNEGILAYIQKAREYYNKALALDPNGSAKAQLAWIAEYERDVKKGINPNEIRGTIKNSGGQPIAYASVRVKDTAAEIMSDQKGQYRFEIPASSETLLVSAKGYKTVEVPVTKSRVYDVTLEQ